MDSMSNPYLAGMPDRSSASGGDKAPAQSPAHALKRWSESDKLLITGCFCRPLKFFHFFFMILRRGEVAGVIFLEDFKEGNAARTEEIFQVHFPLLLSVFAGASIINDELLFAEAFVHTTAFDRGEEKRRVPAREH